MSYNGMKTKKGLPIHHVGGPSVARSSNGPSALSERASISAMLDVLAEEHAMLHEAVGKLSEALLPVRYIHIPEGVGVQGDDGEPQMVQRIQAVIVSAAVVRAQLGALLSGLAL